MENSKIRIKLNDITKVKKFLKITRSFLSDIDVMTERAIVDGKSILGVYALNLADDIFVRIISDNDKEIEEFKSAMEVFQ